VDVVGDIHTLSEHLPGDHFDAVYAISVFEHLAMPWKAVQEIHKVLKPGGLLFLFTHPDYPPHAEPWDFWRFPKSSFGVLLNGATGFKLLSCVEGCPAVIVSLEDEELLRESHKNLAYLGISVLAAKSGDPDPALSWNIPTGEVAPESYPSTYGDLPSKFLSYLEARRKAASRPLD
jgi:SAM-dependent methyltransferase